MSEAARWYQRAAEQGYVNAQHNLGLMYANGEGVYRDLNRAEWWLQQAANQGFQQSFDSLQRVRQARSGGGGRQHYPHPGGHRHRGGW